MLLVSVSNFLHHHDDIVCKQAPRFTPFIFSQFYLPDSVTTTGPNQLHYIVTNNISLIAEVVFRLKILVLHLCCLFARLGNIGAKFQIGSILDSSKISSAGGRARSVV